MKNNETLKSDVLKAIRWEPTLNISEIGVTTKDGVVTLTGTVDNLSKKKHAEDAAKSVLGVKAVVEKIEIEATSDLLNRTDNEIALEIVNAYKTDHAFPDNKVQAKVENGWVTLTGKLNWNHQKERAESTVMKLGGVKGVTNDIQILLEIAHNIEKIDVEKALKRNWYIKTDNIEVIVLNQKVILKGSVESLYQKEAAEKIAWNTPGVHKVENELVINYD